MEVIGAIGVVFFVMFVLFKQPFAFSIVIASMSAATAPAATLMVIRQYRAYGPLTKTILPVVALDDVLGIVAFGIALAVAKLTVSAEPVKVADMFLKPLIEVGGSYFRLYPRSDFIFGFQKAENRDDHQILSIAAIGVATGISKWLGFSPLLTNIVLGTVVVNMVRKSHRVFGSVNDFASPSLLSFYRCRCQFGFSHFKNGRFSRSCLYFSKSRWQILGSYVGAVVTKSEKTVQKYLGFAMLPQGGISIGLSVLVRQQLPEYAMAITTIIMFSVLIYETTGPIFAKFAIKKAGEIDGALKQEPLENITPEKANLELQAEAE